MAITTRLNLNYVTTTYFVSRFEKTYKAGDDFLVSGIYRCVKCGREIAANKDDNPLPPHYPNKTCDSPEWQLLLEAQN